MQCSYQVAPVTAHCHHKVEGEEEGRHTTPRRHTMILYMDTKEVPYYIPTTPSSNVPRREQVEEAAVDLTQEEQEEPRWQ